MVPGVIGISQNDWRLVRGDGPHSEPQEMLLPELSADLGCELTNRGWNAAGEVGGAFEAGQ